MNTSFQQSKNRTDEWYTPPEIIQALGGFDLDPCAPSHDFYTAKKCFTKDDDGLKLNWHGRVWLNPPYSHPLIDRFVKRLAEHGNGIALLFDRMDSALWHDVIFPTSDAMLVMKGRVRFIRQDGSQGSAGGCGSVFVAWGDGNAERLQNCSIIGKYIKLQ